jgi:putative transposase
MKRSGSLKAESRVLQCKKGYPKFQKDCHSVEYKSTGWKLASDRKSINFTDKKGIRRLKPKETRDLHFYSNSTLVREILLLLAGW